MKEDIISIELLQNQLMKKLAQDVGIISELVEFWGIDLINSASEKLEVDYRVANKIKGE